MQQNGINYSVLSLSSPHINFGNREETFELAHDANLQGYQLYQQHPDKLGFLATLPIPYEEDSIEEYQNATENYGALGVTVPTNSRGVYFGTPLLENLYKKLNKDNAIVALHPNEPSILPKNVDIDLPAPLLGFFMDTTMTFVNLLQHHFFEKYPDIRLIIPHAGAFLGILDDRIAQFMKVKYQVDVYEIMQQVYFDLAGAVLPRQLPTILSLANESHILYGSDIPYTPLNGANQLRVALENSKQISKAQKQKFFTDNAKELLTMAK
ncbi:hypothetical protein IV79_GL000412 [Pediococcus claussenii]|nr:hypothetical protein IV79_GL000412 [Pediococcus claussenii]